VKIDTSQFEAVGRDIGRNGGQVGAKAAAAFRKTVHDIEADSNGGAPVDTGALKNSISSEITGDGRFSAMTGEVGPTVDYGIWQEIGTSVMAGHPYLSPAFDRRVPPFIEAVAKLGSEIL
jgi:HK97 gp10 family phage protein